MKEDRKKWKLTRTEMCHDLTNCMSLMRFEDDSDSPALQQTSIGLSIIAAAVASLSMDEKIRGSKTRRHGIQEMSHLQDVLDTI